MEVAFRRGTAGAEPLRPDPVGAAAATHEYRRRVTAGRLGKGTLAWPRGDAPVALGPGPPAVGAPLGCPYCHHAGRVRDFLSLAAPARPARVEVRVRLPVPR